MSDSTDAVLERLRADNALLQGEILRLNANIWNLKAAVVLTGLVGGLLWLLGGGESKKKKKKDRE